MKKVSYIIAIALTFTLLQSPAAFAGYSERLCKNNPNVFCVTVHKGDTWVTLFPDPGQRDIVQRLNRKNTNLYRGQVLAVPNNIDRVSVMELSPFPSTMDVQDRKTIVVDPSMFAWAAYNENGQQVKWGPASAGKSFCADVGRGCRTPGGVYSIYRKEGSGCFSKKFPIGKGGAPMPYCMFFNGGFALHGSPQVPGYHASHGCVRVFTQDARWMNQEFTPNGPTRVIVRSYGSNSDSTSGSGKPKNSFKANARVSASASSEQPIAF